MDLIQCSGVVTQIRRLNCVAIWRLGQQMGDLNQIDHSSEAAG